MIDSVMAAEFWWWASNSIVLHISFLLNNQVN